MNKQHARAEQLVSELTNGSIPKSIIKLSVPLIIANMLMIALELIDAFFVGKLGSDMLAAVSTAGVVVFLLMTIVAGLAVGSVALISRASGTRDFQKAERVAVQALYTGLIASLVIGAIGFTTASRLMEFLGAKGHILETGTAYLKVLFGGMSTMFIMFIGSAVFQGIGDAITPMKISALSTILNIILDPIMIFGLFGCPRMEVVGAAAATVIARAVGGILMIIILLKGRHAVHVKLSSFKPDWPLIKEIVVIGFPSSIQMLLRSFSGVVLIKITALFGSVAVAAFGIGIRLQHLFLFPGFGFGAAAATLVGQNLGAEQPDRASKSALLAVSYYLVYLLACGGMMFIFAPQIAALFNNETELVRTAGELIRYLAAGSLFLSTGVVLSRALQGAGDTITPMVYTGVSLYIVQIPLAYLFANMGFNETGVWMSMFAGSMVNGIVILAVFLRGKWKYKRVFQPAGSTKGGKAASMC